MRTRTFRINNKLFIAAGALALVLPLGACTVEKTDDGELPEVDIQAEGGELPEYDVDAAEVEVGTKEVTATVPDIDVKMPDEDDDGGDDGSDDDGGDATGAGG